jgi:hypothetical protein
MQGAEKLPYLRKILKEAGVRTRFLGMNVSSMIDLELKTTAEQFHVLRIQRKAPQTDSDGPGGRAWMWPDRKIEDIYSFIKSKSKSGLMG